MNTQIRPFLMFQGNAETAMNFYVSVFPGGQVVDIVRYGASDGAVAGLVRRAVFSIAGQSIVCIDSPVQHDFSFTPALSLFIDCASEDEIGALWARLSDGGVALMPLGEYGFSRRFAWLNDKFGVSWQLNLA